MNQQPGDVRANSNPGPTLADVIGKLGPAFRATAADHDRSARFVADNYRLAKEHKLFSAGVPRELGGGGRSHSELADGLRQLGQYCGSTALALSMHTHLVAATVFRHRHGQPGEALLRKVAASELVLVSTGAGDWVDSVGRAERKDGGYLVSGVKRFCSGAPSGDVLITSAPHDDVERGAEVLHFPVPLAAKGVRVLDDWDTLGMRGTGSVSIELDGVFVPEEAVVVRRPRGRWHPMWNVIVTVASPLYLAPYIGVAERALQLAREAAAQKTADALLFQGLGEIENALATAQMAWREMVANANDYDFEPKDELASRSLVRKTIATNAAMATVAKAIELVGGSAYYRRSELERLFRDIQGAQFHPLPEKKQLEFTGRVSLGLSPVA